MTDKEAYEYLNRCINCSSYNTIKCMTCDVIYGLNEKVNYITQKFCEDYEIKNNIVHSDEKVDNYKFDTVFEQVEEKEDENVIDVENP